MSDDRSARGGPGSGESVASALEAFRAEVARLRRENARLRREKEGYESLTWHNPDLVARFDRELRHLYVNPAIQAATGRPPAHFIGKTNEELGWPPALCRYWREVQESVFETGEERLIEFEFPSPGGPRIFQSRIVPERDRSGNVSAILGISRDITAIRRAEEALRRSERELADFFENATIGLHRVGRDGTVLWANRHELEMLGYEPDEYIGHHISEFHVDRDVIEEILDRLSRGEQMHRIEARLRRKDGSIRHVRISSSALLERGEFVHTRCFTTDVTDEKRAAEERERLIEALEAANQAKSRFLATVSHELRTPLNAVLGYAELLADGIPVAIPDTAHTHVERIALSARHLIQLIDEILDFSRMEAGREAVDTTPVALCEIVDEVRAIAEPLARAKGLEFHVSPPPDDVRLETDPRKVRQILLNLVGNAIKFTDAGTVRFRVHDGDEWLGFEVEDTGIGIAPEQLDRIFEPFWQAAVQPGGPQGGTGLGLTVARQFAELLGGEIQVRSEPDVGTRFVVRLPLRQPSGVDAAGLAP